MSERTALADPPKRRRAGEITDEEMANLNFRVDDGGEEPEDVARDFLSSGGYIEG